MAAGPRVSEQCKACPQGIGVCGIPIAGGLAGGPMPVRGWEGGGDGGGGVEAAQHWAGNKRGAQPPQKGAAAAPPSCSFSLITHLRTIDATVQPASQLHPSSPSPPPTPFPILSHSSLTLVPLVPPCSQPQDSSPDTSSSWSTNTAPGRRCCCCCCRGAFCWGLSVSPSAAASASSPSMPVRAQVSSTARVLKCDVPYEGVANE